MNLGEKIKYHREELNMSQKELATKAKISQSSLHYIENNVNSPSVDNLKKISEALGISLITLIGEETA